MRRTAFSRAVSLLVALLVASSAPGLAIAHGNAHRSAAQHASEHQAAPVDTEHWNDDDRAHAHGPDSAPESSAALSAAAVNADDHGDHAHPELTSAISTRPDAQLFVVPVGPPVALAVVSITAAQSFDGIRAVPGGPPLLSPRQPRAPPLG